MIKIVAYLSSFEQLKNAEELNIKNFILKPDEALLSMGEIEIRKSIDLLKKQKNEIVSLDFNIPTYDLYKDDFDSILKQYEQAIAFANTYKIENIFLRLPKIDDITTVYDLLKTQLDKFLELAQKYKKIFVLYPELHHGHTFAYIIKNYGSKHFKFYYQMSNFYDLKVSPVSAYRILKKDILFLEVGDADIKNEVDLLGYGKKNAVDLLNRFKRDKYQGFIILDQRIAEFLEGLGKDKRKLFGLIPLKDQKQKKILKWQQIIFGDDKEKNVTYNDIFKNQKKLIEKIFKED